MSTPVPGLPDAAGSSPTFTFGGYATEPAGLAGASFWPRVAARVIDLVVHYCISFAAGMFFTILLAAASGGHIPFWVLVKLRHVGFPGFAAGLVGSFAYHVVGVSVHGSTLGKRVLSIGSGSGRRHALPSWAGDHSRTWLFHRRNLLWLDRLFCDAKEVKERRHGDEWAGTVVCKRSSVAPDQLRGDGRFALALMMGMMADAALLMIGLLVVINR
jgi:hypothetical protein